uniref:Transmembrane protein 138 n=1 Tax=Salmo trutta TaxID=8032 RepID=A0A673WWB8_SALTR
MLQTNNYSLVLLVQLGLLTYDLCVNSFSELLRAAPVIQLGLLTYDLCVNSFSELLRAAPVIQLGLLTYDLCVNSFSELLRAAPVIQLVLFMYVHDWLCSLWLESNSLTWTNGLQVLFVSQRVAAVLYYYFYKRTTECLGDPRLYDGSVWPRDAFVRARQ